MRSLLLRLGVLGLSVGLLAGCATQSGVQPETVQAAAAKKMGQIESILILPPKNITHDVDASNAIYASTQRPLAESGYYVVPISVVDQVLKANGVTVADQAHEISTEKLHWVFGADAALYITVTEYGSKFQFLNSQSVVAIHARLVNLSSGEVLWDGRKRVVQEQNQSPSTVGLLGSLVQAVVNHVINTLSDESRRLGFLANEQMLSWEYDTGLPPGPYRRAVLQEGQP